MKFHPLFRYLVHIPAYLYIILFLAASIVTGMITTFLPEPIIENPFTIDNRWIEMFVVLLIAPLLETRKCYFTNIPERTEQLIIEYL